MKFVSDPSIAVKIRKMEQRVRWKDRLILERSIDQTRFVIDDSDVDNPEFSFLVVGDSGTGHHRSHNPQRQLAEVMLDHFDDSRFVLHTGDVVYLVGSSEYYPHNFIYPYREYIVGGENPHQVAYDQMVFKKPFLPVPGNHDYYDLPVVYGILAQASWPLRRLLRSHIDLDVGWHGSFQGKAYAKAFLDYLKAFNLPTQLKTHLDSHYTAKLDTGRCLRYQPGRFTRLPNRYYSFRYGGIDFFALDSNTFNAPQPLPQTREGDAIRRLLQERRAELERQQQQILENSTQLNPEQPEEDEQLDDTGGKLEQIEEMIIDIDKQLTADSAIVTDWEQLEWLKRGLIESWNTEEVRGRVVYFHHPPYVTEATKWDQSQTLEMRYHFRQVLDAVAQQVGEQAGDRPLVDLVLSGHAHCLEYLQTGDTGHADSHIHWLVCGGSGHSLRRQRKEGPELMETFERGETRSVARSHLFLGRSGQGSHKRRPYSALRIDVRGGQPPKFIIRPLVAERIGKSWYAPEIDPAIVSF